MRRNYYEAYRPIDPKSEMTGIEVRWAGRAHCPQNFELNRYHKRYLLLYIIRGACFLDDGGVEREVEAGNIVLFRPNGLQRFRAHGKKSLKYYGVSFNGRFIDLILAETPLMSAKVHHVGDRPALCVMFHKLIGEMLTEEQEKSEVIWGLFLQLLGEIQTAVAQAHIVKDDNFLQEYRLQKAAEYIRLNYNLSLNLENIASTAGYSISWFENLFRKKYMMPPIKYQMKLRIDKAKEMISFGMLNISEICYAVGFNDPLYFSKVFKKHVGVSPKYYKNINSPRAILDRTKQP